MKINEIVKMNQFIILQNFMIVIIGIIKVISMSKIKKIIKIKKKCKENERRGVLCGSNPHSNGDNFSSSLFLFLERNNAKIIIRKAITVTIKKGVVNR